MAYENLPRAAILILILAFAAWRLSGLGRPTQSSRVKGALHRWYWYWALSVYCSFAVYVLWHSFPVFIDGAGPIPSLWLGRSVPLLTLEEYNSHERYYHALFLAQHWVVAFGMAAIAMLLTPALIARSRWLSTRLFRAQLSISWVGLLLIWVGADVGTRLGICHVGTISLERDVFLFLFNITAPPALLSAVLALTRRRLATSHNLRFDSAVN